MKKVLLSVFLAAFIFTGCSVYQSIVNLTRLKFKLDGVTSISVAGINVLGKNSISDFNFGEIASVTASVIQGTLPVALTLNVAALNPNDGTGGYAQTDATLKSFPYRFVVDGKDFITGNIANPISIPGTGQTTNIGLNFSLDLAQLLAGQGYESLLNTVLMIAGVGKGQTQIALYAQPVVSTIIGDIQYPGEIKIIDTEFTR
ncbi:MAG: hypothetical protein IAE91_11370 [Ignavibacteriaceae bacterium]|nr:hypothetical protein [Ignavibacteriaceae bacterium]